MEGLIQRQPKALIVFEALLALALIGSFNYYTGSKISVSLLYSLAVLAVAWFADRRAAIIFAFLSALVYWCVNRESSPYGTDWGYAWVTFSRLAIFLLVAAGGSAMRLHEESNRERIEALERSVALEHEVTRISEHEQRRIGQDLHDGICQELVAIAYAISSIRDDLAAKDIPEAEQLGEVQTMLKATIHETRNLARGIFPAQLEEIGLPAMLDELVISTRRLQRIDATFEMEGDVRISDPEVATHLYRITQEALGNAVKHGTPSCVSVLLAKRDGAIVLEVKDEGGGMAKSERQPHGIGLKTMDYRARLIGATIEIKNNAEGGVTVTCVLPVTSPQDA